MTRSRSEFADYITALIDSSESRVALGYHDICGDCESSVIKGGELYGCFSAAGASPAIGSSEVVISCHSPNSTGVSSHLLKEINERDGWLFEEISALTWFPLCVKSDLHLLAAMADDTNKDQTGS